MRPQDSISDLVIGGSVMERQSEAERVNSLGCPPQKFVAGVVLVVVMQSAQWHGPLVGCLLPPAGLPLAVDSRCRADMSRVRSLDSADAATQRADECKVLLVLDAWALLLCGGHREGGVGAD